MGILDNLIECIRGPQLYRLQGRNYVGNSMEMFSNSIAKFFRISYQITAYTSPIILIYLYKRGYIYGDQPANYYYLMKLAILCSIAYISAVTLRGIGRLNNDDYISFISNYKSFKTNQSHESRLLLNHYDFDFRWWPIDYQWNQSQFTDPKKPIDFQPTSLSRRTSSLDRIKKLPCDLISFFVIHTFGRRMIYPGSTSLFNALVEPALIQGRINLIERENGKRFKLLSRDGNEIDTMFVDNRNRTGNEQGKTLVICCEGNAGFYEIGTPATPLRLGYSILGWNHPGFSGSTGVPWPQSEVNSIDVVVNFAIDKLGFKLEEIIMFGWSIGGFTASWAAMQYPQLKAVILDASFDDIVPLAESKMPQSWKPLVHNTLRNYFNLKISDQLNQYQGPVLLIRRTLDEIICTNEQHSLKTNRGNELFVKLMQNRFPNLLSDETVKKELIQHLHLPPLQAAAIYPVNKQLCLALLISYIENHGPSYPLKIGDDLTLEQKIQLVIFLKQLHFKDFDSTHCTPLDPLLFTLPFDLLSLTKESNKL